MKIARAWQTFWFSPVPVERVAVFRIIVVGYALFEVVVRARYMIRYGDVPDSFYEPILLLQMSGLERVGPAGTRTIYVAMVVALVMAFIGVRTRAALWASLALYVWWFATFYSFGKIDHGQVGIAFALGVLAIAPSGRALSWDARRLRRREHRTVDGQLSDLAGWALRVIQVLIVLTYLLSAYAKFSRGGLAWLTGPTLELFSVERGTRVGLLLAEQSYILVVAQIATIVVESTAWVVVFGGRVRLLWLSTVALFHIGVFVVLGINFLGLVVCFAAFFPLERLSDGLRSQWGANRVGGLMRAPGT